jgi:nucleoside 2-deoxyribosyltransferase
MSDLRKPKYGRLSAETWEDRARRDLEPKVASSAYVISLAPEKIDPKVALEMGYALLLDKPIVAVVPPGRSISRNLGRVAERVIRLSAPLSTEAGTQELMAALGSLGSLGDEA